MPDVMAEYRKVHNVPEDFPEAPLFQVERREIVGEVFSSTSGKKSPIEAGFEIMGHYLSHNPPGDGISLSFDFEGQHFSASVEPGEAK